MGNMKQTKPQTGDLFEDKNFEYHPLKAHRMQQYITIKHGQLGSDIPAHVGLAIDYTHLIGGGFKKNAVGKVVKIWRQRA